MRGVRGGEMGYFRTSKGLLWLHQCLPCDPSRCSFDPSFAHTRASSHVDAPGVGGSHARPATGAADTGRGDGDSERSDWRRAAAAVGAADCTRRTRPGGAAGWLWGAGWLVGLALTASRVVGLVEGALRWDAGCAVGGAGCSRGSARGFLHTPRSAVSECLICVRLAVTPTDPGSSLNLLGPTRASLPSSARPAEGQRVGRSLGGRRRRRRR